MQPDHVDVLVVGGGPAGSIAALVLARAGASVAVVDKARFPRDKACGDLVGPRGLQVLADLGVEEPAGTDVGDLFVMGPGGRRVRLPSAPGLAYPGRGRAVTRAVFDLALRRAALDAGARAVEGRAGTPVRSDSGLSGFDVARPGAGTRRLTADFVIGADGATSHVARMAGLVDTTRVLWGFAVRSYVAQPVDLPVIALWEQGPGRAFPGYGWIFPGPDGVANVGLGVGTLADRSSGAAAVRALPDFFDHLRRHGLLAPSAAGPVPARLGGWLKMGMVGTLPARGRVLLVGDAAGLVNPLQGEGIAQAMASGRAAAQAIVGTPAEAAVAYRRRLADQHLPYHRVAAAGHAALVGRPRAVSVLGRAVTSPVVGPRLAGGWGLFWNELLQGAAPGPPRTIATATTALARAVTAPTGVSRWFATAYPRSGR